MRNGYVKLWRKITDSPVFANEGMLKLFIICLSKASRYGREIDIPGILSPIPIQPGQFISGRYSLHEDYHQAQLKKKRYSRKTTPTPYTVWRWLLALEKMEILTIQCFNKYSIISIINWDIYQGDPPQTLDAYKLDTFCAANGVIHANSEHQKQSANTDKSSLLADEGSDTDHQVSIRRASSEHKQESIKKEKETPCFFSLLQRYPNHDLINRCFQAVASTRKSGKVADSILLAQLQKWERYPVKQVQAGIQVYLEKDYAGQGRNENYLLGVIRNQKGNPSAQPKKLEQIVSSESPPIFSASNPQAMKELLSNA